MSLYQKHRPTELADLHGNKELKEALSSMLCDSEKCPHAFLLTGPTGCGKTTIGRIIAKSVGASGIDIKEIDNTDFRSLDSIREIRSQCNFLPMESKAQAWIMDECHQLLAPSQSALLKVLEDTPKHVYFVLCTTDPQKLLPTLKGRCSQFVVGTLSDDEMLGLLRKVVKAEGKSIAKKVYEQIIQDSLGHARNALVILGKVLQVSADTQLETAKQSAELTSQSIELCRALMGNAGWKQIASILSGLKEQDSESTRRQVLGYCAAVLTKTENDKAGLIMENFIEPFYNSGFPGLVFACYSVVKG